ncbi:(2Fe-2S)-binding protein [Nocardioides pyridinolyticus]
MSTELSINGERHAVDVPPLTPLVTVLREHLALTGTKAACHEGFCGSCTVLVDDRPAVSCLLPVALAGGREVRTVESLARGNESLSPVQQAFKDADVVQCGMCFPGLLMTLTALVEQGQPVDDSELRRALVGNICRCTGYEQILAAAHEALASMGLSVGSGAPA